MVRDCCTYSEFVITLNSSTIMLGYVVESNLQNCFVLYCLLAKKGNYLNILGNFYPRKKIVSGETRVEHHFQNRPRLSFCLRCEKSLVHPSSLHWEIKYKPHMHKRRLIMMLAKTTAHIFLSHLP